MDRNFHTDDFERLLREKSDEFRMYPSKRIWHSIYNNIHPGRKWPSVAMSITLITALFLMGYLNTKNTNSYTGESVKIIPQQTIAQVKSITSSVEGQHLNFFPYQLKEKVTGPVHKSGISNQGLTNNSLNAAITAGSNKNISKAATVSPFEMLDITNQLASVTKISPVYTQVVTDNNVSNKAKLTPAFTDAIGFNAAINDPQIKTATVNNDYQTLSTDTEDQSGLLTYAQRASNNDMLQNLSFYNFNANSNKTSADIKGGNSAAEKNNSALGKNSFISREDKDWIDNYALYNRPAGRRWINKLTWEMYATPSVVYRTLYNDPSFGVPVNSTPFAISAANQDVNKSVKQIPSMGLEIGTGFLYSISKMIKLKAGIQFNYTRYNAEAFQNTHPFTARITMHDYEKNMAYEEVRTTPYSNKSGLEAIKLHNETFQLSLPVGVDLRLIGNDNLQWNVGATIQPTYVPFGKSYLISSDRRNYVKESSMLNRWNLNAGFETFVSYKTGNGLTWQIGPQFRTQLFSTNNKQIAVEEKLVSYGVKVGISKTIK